MAGDPKTDPKGNAYITLLTSDSYLAGALVLLKSLKETRTKTPVAIAVVPELVSENCVEILHRFFDAVIFVPSMRSTQAHELWLLGRTELDITFTKIHVWNPDWVPYEKIVYLDADVLVLENIDSLFDYVNDTIVFGAAPDVGWPDCFNSGVFVTKPNREMYQDLVKHAVDTGSFDGMKCFYDIVISCT